MRASIPIDNSFSFGGQALLPVLPLDPDTTYRALVHSGNLQRLTDMTEERASGETISSIIWAARITLRAPYGVAPALAYQCDGRSRA